MKQLNVLELYSGIGGMHMALKASNVPFNVCAAIEINPNANNVYKHNFKHTKLLNKNICQLSPEFVTSLGVNAIFMSPPCQPFTRNGQQKDINDTRTQSFVRILNILHELTNVEYVLIENVKGFETSTVRDMLIDALDKCSFVWQEFLLSPVQFNIPNSRLRYYCLSKRKPLGFCGGVSRLYEAPFNCMQLNEEMFKLEKILEKNVHEKYSMPKRFLKFSNTFDTVDSDSKRSCCFTKAYTRYVEGTGSVIATKNQEENELTYRFFTEREICRLMCIPEEFEFPEQTTLEQRYKLLGNSLNVSVVSCLIKHLMCENSTILP